MIYNVKNIFSLIVLKFIVKIGGVIDYCGIVCFVKYLDGFKVYVECDMIIMDDQLFFNMILYNEIDSVNVVMEYEVKVFKILEEQFYYLMS